MRKGRAPGGKSSHYCLSKPLSVPGTDSVLSLVSPLILQATGVTGEENETMSLRDLSGGGRET